MIEEEKDKELESLFRNRLEESELAPGSELTGRFMRRLGRREFMRFNAARLNIFYVGAAAVAAAALSGLLLFKPAQDIQDKNESELLPQVELTSPVQETEIATEEKDQAGHNDSTLPGIDDKGTSASTVKAPVNTGRVKEEIGPVKAEAKTLKVTRQDGINEIAVNKTGSPRAAFEASMNSGCVPLNVTFRNLSSGGQKTEWSFGDGGYSSENDVDYIYDIPGTYDVILTVTNGSGYEAVASTRVEVWPRPKASFEIPETDISESDGVVAFNNLSTDASRYIWYFGDGTSSEDFEPVHKYDKYGKYDVTLVAISDNGCTDSVSIVDAFTDSGLYLRFPNAFAPDAGGPTGGYYSQRSDANNQVFHPVSSGVVSYELKIYSKQGLLVFETDDLLKGWDGYYKGRLCSPGVYIWKVRGTYRNGAQVVMSGDVTLLSY